MKVRLQRGGGTLALPGAPDVGSGGEANVYSVPGCPDLVAKVYHRPTAERQAKLEAMVASPPSDDGTLNHRSIAWPVDLLSAEHSGKIIGYVMPRLRGMHPILELYNPKSRIGICPGFDYLYLVRTGRNVAAAVRSLHAKGHVVGDINESNILVSDRALSTFVDADSFQIRGPKGRVFRCPVGKAEFTPPELQGVAFSQVDRLPSHDAFGLAVIVFQLLMEGHHPFAGKYTGQGEDPYPLPADAIAARAFPYGRRGGRHEPPPFAPPYSMLPSDVQSLIERCFEAAAPDTRPPAAEWLAVLDAFEQSLVECRKTKAHKYDRRLATCPWCERAARLGRDSFVPQPSPQKPLPKAPPVRRTIPAQARPPATRTTPPAPARPRPPQGVAPFSRAVLVGAIFIVALFLVKIAWEAAVQRSASPPAWVDVPPTLTTQPAAQNPGGSAGGGQQTKPPPANPPADPTADPPAAPPANPSADPPTDPLRGNSDDNSSSTPQPGRDPLRNETGQGATPRSSGDPLRSQPPPDSGGHTTGDPLRSPPPPAEDSSSTRLVLR